jgi:phenylalanyl-tRNA synthetase beta chain
MQFSEAWLRSLVNPALDTQKLGHLLTMAGLEVEALEPVAPAFSQVVIGEILSAEKHPNADRLQVCLVDVGESQPLTIVCGAPNARAGLKTACALVGAILPGAQLEPLQIKQAKVRSVESFGMLCSSKELGIPGDAAGILELATDAPVGKPLRQWLNLDDSLITLKLTPNRGDCLSVQGIAREVAALAASPLTPVDCTPVAASCDASYPVAIEADAACPRYCGREIRGINAGASTPRWMVERLERSGLRVLHPVVDVTNYVLLELGQPMHGFDLGRLQGGIRVRMGRARETLALLNDQTITLAEDALTIADDSGALALAGIMGGAASAVSDTTTDIFLEAAHFDPDAIAGRARRYGLSTDSSHRFERGVDPELPRRAMERATRLILDLCGGECGPIVEAGPGVAARPAIAFRPARVRRLLGFDLADTLIRDILQRLDLRVGGEGDTWSVTIPSHRFDLTGEVDLIEEIARVHGYDAIPVVAPRGVAAMLPAGEGRRTPHDLKKLMAARGYQEVITYSFISEERDREFRAMGETLPLLNPIASQMGVMRGSLMGGLIEVLEHNLNHGQERLRLFEIGRAFHSAAADGQPLHAAGIAYGAAHAEQWGEPARAVDYYDLKADVEALLHPLPATFAPDTHPALHPGQCASVRQEGVAIGWIGALHPRLTQVHGLSRAPILFELDLTPLLAGAAPRYQGVPRLPAVRRDIAVVVDGNQPLAAMLEAVRGAMPPLISEFALFDVYQGQGVESGKKSLAFKMLLQHTEKTLTETEIETAVHEVVGILTTQFNASLRR